MSKENREVLVHVDHMKKYFPVRKKGVLKAVDDVSFNIYKGETLGLVGESGCGKTTCGRTVLGLYPVTEGTVEYAGKNVTNLKKNDLNWFKKRAQMIFQDPVASLNPRMTVEEIIAEGAKINNIFATKEELKINVKRMLELVGLTSEHATRYPHEFSGGQRQRICIARALITKPDLVIADEPISALDVSIQAQVVNMFEDLQKKFGMAYLFIAHDLLIVQHISDRIAVMYLGKMMEIAPSDELNNHPIHPYTLSLLSAVPIPDPETARKSHRIVLEGDVPSPLNMPSGCPFRTRCAYATEQCAKEMPPLTDRGGEHFVACWNK